MLLVLKIDIYLLWVGLDTSKIRGIHKITDEILQRQATRDKKGWTQRVGLANVSPKGLYHGIRG